MRDRLEQLFPSRWAMTAVIGTAAIITFGLMGQRLDDLGHLEESWTDASDVTRFWLKQRISALEYALASIAVRDSLREELRRAIPRNRGVRAQSSGPRAVDPSRFEKSNYAAWAARPATAPLQPVLISSIGNKSLGHLGGMVVLPWASDGRTCVILDPSLHGSVVASRNERVPNFRVAAIDLCGMVSRHPLPGPTMRRWLETTNYAPLVHPARGDRGAPISFGFPVSSVDARLMRALGDLSGYLHAERMRLGVAACAIGDDASCDQAVRDARTLAPARPAGEGIYTLAQSFSGVEFSFSIGEQSFLDHLEQDIGPQRFTELWSTSEPLDVAYPRIVGEPIGRTLQRYTREALGGRDWYSPMRWQEPLATTAILLLIGFGIAAAALRRREVSA